jgi:hypothetical protein
MPGSFFVENICHLVYEDTVFDLTADPILKMFDIYIYDYECREGERERREKHCGPENS